MNKPGNTEPTIFHSIGMTLRQLLASCPFDSLAPILSQKNDMSLAQYKEAYDILLNIEASEYGCRNVRIENTRWGLSAWNVEGAEWECIIDGQVLVGNGVGDANQRLACEFLWSLTYFGYSPENIELRSFDEYSGTRFGEEAWRVELRRYMACANKHIRSYIMESADDTWENVEEHNFALPEEYWRYIHKRESHCNRSKRKRNYRLERRIRRLKSLNYCETTVRQLLDGQTASTSTTRDDLNFLFHTDERAGREMQSRTFGKRDRTEYILELINKYGALGGMPENQHIAMRIATSHDCPLTDNEREQICFTVGKVCNAAATTFCIAEDNNLGCEMSLLVVTNK